MHYPMDEIKAKNLIYKYPNGLTGHLGLNALRFRISKMESEANQEIVPTMVKANTSHSKQKF